MQNVLGRTAAAKRQAARRAAKLAAKEARETRVIQRNQHRNNEKLRYEDIRKARKTRREDWELGPLAPKRDVGDFKHTYGTVSQLRLQDSFAHLTKKPIKESDSWLYVGDRVVLLEGRDKGKIGTIDEINFEEQWLTVNGLNMADIPIPKWIKDTEGHPEHTVPRPLAIPLTGVRLVCKINDPATNQPRDVIVERVRWQSELNVKTGKREKHRIIPYINHIIPKPAESTPEEQDTPSDTLRILAEEKTFVPTLLRPPMPEQVIDELRGKYSKFRDRHDEDFIAKKKAEDEAKSPKNLKVTMRTPAQDLSKRDKQLKKEARMKRYVPFEEILAAVGAHMAKKQGVVQSIGEQNKESVVPPPPSTSQAPEARP
ncbi:hypothetical protein M501DRAFT_990576 [Patellaria atrata CBS 101060]|uniref:KOW domain-containing protein n=1 Tax=Patellaria atrata CBS 101060 TaxID=1346257 RepID=A0A9P4SD96_9PEZI|nr:hypothetical protein M501DRAFT_990576 [Patellaria atrata CBS 101060]